MTGENLQYVFKEIVYVDMVYGTLCILQGMGEV